MSDDDHVRVNHRVPNHVRDAAQDKTEHGELSELVRNLYKRVAFGEDVAQHDTVKLELERVRDEKDDVRRQIRELEAELETIESKERRLEEKLSKHNSRQDKYEGHVESLESQLLDGTHISPSHPGVQRAANVGECDGEDVIDDLRERNPEVPDYAFEDMMHAEREWTGLRNGGDGR